MKYLRQCANGLWVIGRCPPASAKRAQTIQLFRVALCSFLHRAHSHARTLWTKCMATQLGCAPHHNEHLKEENTTSCTEPFLPYSATTQTSLMWMRVIGVVVPIAISIVISRQWKLEKIQPKQNFCCWDGLIWLCVTHSLSHNSPILSHNTYLSDLSKTSLQDLVSFFANRYLGKRKKKTLYTKTKSLEKKKYAKLFSFVFAAVSTPLWFDCDYSRLNLCWFESDS